LGTEEGFDYNTTTNQLTVDSLNVIHLTSSFITASNIKTSGSNIFGDDTTDTQTLIGTILMTGSAQITGSLGVTNNINVTGTIVGSNLSGTNTGDQNLSSFALKTAISGSFVAPSSSFSTRVTFLEEGGAVGFTSSGISGSLGTNAALIRSLTATGISGSFESPSASFSDRITATTLTVVSNTTKVDSVITVTGSYAITGSNNFIGNQTITGSLFVSGSVYRTANILSTTANVTQSIHSLSTSSFDGAFIEYTAVSASNARAGNIMSVWDGINVTFAETTTADIGDTSNLLFQVALTQSVAQIQSYTTSTGYRLRTIIKAI
tara:strand:- start:91 stop:1053 length:963 start_codon:yes stop_codon:yes gene_type:complete